MVCHALTGDQYVTGYNPITKREGWWSRMVGPNKPIDTNKFFVKSGDVINIEPVKKRFFVINSLSSGLSLIISSLTLYFLLTNE